MAWQDWAKVSRGGGVPDSLGAYVYDQTPNFSWHSLASLSLSLPLSLRFFPFLVLSFSLPPILFSSQAVQFPIIPFYSDSPPQGEKRPSLAPRTLSSSKQSTSVMLCDSPFSDDTPFHSCEAKKKQSWFRSYQFKSNAASPAEALGQFLTISSILLTRKRQHGDTTHWGHWARFKGNLICWTWT